MKLKQGTEQEYAEYIAKNSGDDYSKGVVNYTERWAALMEEEIKAGFAITDIAEKTSHAADTEGITGFMYGCAVSALAKFWEHGETLRRWHNREYLPEDKAQEADKTGGVVNPAIVTINV